MQRQIVGQYSLVLYIVGWREMQKCTEVKVETSKERSETNLLCALTYGPNVL